MFFGGCFGSFFCSQGVLCVLTIVVNSFCGCFEVAVVVVVFF